MTDKYKNKYRVSSARLQKWDYGWAAPYFVTINTKDRVHYFGEVINGEMILSEMGRVANDEWTKTPIIRPDMNIELDEFCVMPNHFHCIIIIGKNNFNQRKTDGGTDDCGLDGRTDALQCVSTQNPIPPSPKNQFGPQRKNLGSIIGGYKSAVTTYARINNIEFDWQARFHEHIIRDNTEFQRIKWYIKNNPKNWDKDILNK
ncbi:MAG: hypothetical protein DRJ05_12495 [Bacteroidetes bacterium]|nr:MAG: hypothetical protein DRJ05_12495 [Bacteroidota bacterium]